MLCGANLCALNNKGSRAMNDEMGGWTLRKTEMRVGILWNTLINSLTAHIM